MQTRILIINILVRSFILIFYDLSLIYVSYDITITRKTTQRNWLKKVIFVWVKDSDRWILNDLR